VCSIYFIKRPFGVNKGKEEIVEHRFECLKCQVSNLKLDISDWVDLFLTLQLLVRVKFIMLNKKKLIKKIKKKKKKKELRYAIKLIEKERS
jgi:hypothetical protein